MWIILLMRSFICYTFGVDQLQDKSLLKDLSNLWNHSISKKEQSKLVFFFPFCLFCNNRKKKRGTTHTHIIDAWSNWGYWFFPNSSRPPIFIFRRTWISISPSVIFNFAHREFVILRKIEFQFRVYDSSHLRPIICLFF